ncbi:MAG: hypothetical protein LBT08_08760 [Synergistaceae bacterium]|nr:hypothetical protein [Synergistaceae bacterium]
MDKPQEQQVARLITSSGFLICEACIENIEYHMGSDWTNGG